MDNLLWGLKKNSQQLKDIIVKILSEAYPLTAKQLHKKILLQTYRSNVSYQAVHQIAKELVEHGILIKVKNEYMISLEWIDKLNNFAMTVRNFYLNKTKINLQDEPSKSFLDVLEKYKCAIIKDFSQFKDLPFLEVSPSLLADFNSRETLINVKRNILNILRDNKVNSFLLIGDSGSGKSTLMKMTAYEYASRGKLIPIYLKLNRYSGESLVQIVKQQIQRITGEDVRVDMVKILLSEGTFLFLFDALNEASGQVKVDFALLNRYDLVLDKLNEFIDTYKNNIFVISSRTYNDPKQRLPITAFKLNKLDDKKIKIILKKENAPELSKKIAKDKKLFSLCQNPLILSMLIKSKRFNFKNKSQLYEYFIQIFLNKGEVNVNDVIQILSHLAYQLNFICFSLPYGEAYHLMEKASLELGISKEKTDNLIEFIFDSGIITRENGHCEFMQKSVQEYLAAKELKNKNFGKKELLEIIKNKQWHASLLFYAAMQDNLQDLLGALYDQFTLTGEHNLLFLATNCLIDNGKNNGELFNKIINSLLNIYNYHDEKFYFYWYELNEIFERWDRTRVNNKIVNHFSNLNSEISARMTNILFHSKRNIGYSRNKKLFTKLISDDSNPHLQYSLIELVGIHKLPDFLSLIFPKIKSEDPLMSAVVIWTIEQIGFSELEEWLKSNKEKQKAEKYLSCVKEGLFQRISKLIKEAKEDYVTGHCMIELARLDYNKAVSIIFSHLNNKTLIKYHACYALSREERVDMSLIFNKIWRNKFHEIKTMLKVGENE
jgi:predicted transcriptional regulator/ABC-type oligopeptide transport system ATPase subunit